MKLTSRRYVAAAGVATLATLAATALALTPASAASPRLEVNTTTIRAAAGSCAVVVVTPRDTFGGDSSATETVTLLLDEQPTSGAQDLDFCVSSSTDPSYTADTPSEAPNYTNGADFGLPPNPDETYQAGPGITGSTTSSSCASGNNVPDNADNSSQPSPNTSQTGGKYACTNPSGQDRARYTYRAGSGGIRVGVVGRTAGSGTIRAFFDSGSGTSTNDNDYTPESGEVQAPTVNFTVTAGGTPASVEASDAISDVTADPVDDAAPPGVQQLFTATLKNSSGDGVRGVRPLVQVASNGANPGASASCGDSNNDGVAKCSFTGTTPGTDTLTVYVNRAGGSAGPDFGEKRAVITRTTTKPAVAPAEARYLDLTPPSQTVTSGRSDTFTATVTDVNGAPAQNVSVTFTETGPGQFSNGSSTFTGFTDVTGRLRVRVDTLASESGTQDITAAISTVSTQCSQPAGAGTGSTATTPAGRCSDTATNTITSASPSPTPSASATPTGSGSPTPTRSLTLSLDSPSTITPGTDSLMTARGTPGASVVLRCYSRFPENSQPGMGTPPYFDARTDTLDSGGAFQFALHPGTNTRCFVKYAGAADSDVRNSASVVQNVATNLSLSAYRDGVRKYHFQGTNLPRRSGMLITLYRYATPQNTYCVPAPETFGPAATSGSCQAIRTATAFTNSNNVWRIDRTFTGSGQFYFVARTSATLTNVAGYSNQRLTIIH